MKILFMGTPDIAATALTALLRDQHKLVGAFTREDKPVGRKQQLTAPPVKVLAEDNGIPVYQPSTLKDAACAEIIRTLAPELIVVVAYGRILPPEILAIPPHGCVNLHVSLLPKYRGAAPIQWAIINGEAQTGVSIMQMDEGLDTGPVLAQRTLSIAGEQTAGEVFEMVGHIGARLLATTVADIAAGRAQATPQTGQPSLAPPLTKQMAQLDFEKEAKTLHNLVRGCNPWPLAWFTSGGKRIKVLRTRVAEGGTGRAGEIVSVNPLRVTCGQGILELLHLVPEGSRAMTGADWAAGRRFGIGDTVL